MSKYTTEVRFICEMSAGLTESVGYNNVDEVLDACNQDVIGDYPIFDETYRETLNKKILKHYYTREICEETVGLWKLRLNTRMNEIMPYYNKMYSSELLNFNPFYDVDLSTEHVKNEDTAGNFTSNVDDSRNDSKNSQNVSSREDDRVRDTQSETVGENQTNSTNRNESHSGVNATVDSTKNKNELNKYSETPQGGITGLQNDTYLTNARIIDADESDNQQTNQQTDAVGSTDFAENGSSKDSTSGSESEHSNIRGKNENSEIASSSGSTKRNDENKVNSTEDYIEHVQGKRGGTSFSKLLTEFRETFLNIDRMVIDELSDLFFGLWE